MDSLLTGVDALVPDGSLKLGFRAHYPQLETKLTVRGADMADVRRKLEPVEKESASASATSSSPRTTRRWRASILGALADRGGTLALVETFTGGLIAARLAPQIGAEKIVTRGIVSRDLSQVQAAVGLVGPVPGEITPALAEEVAAAARRLCGATHALAVLVDLDDGPDRIEFGGTINLAIATADGAESRRSRILGGREWVRLGATELGMDCLRRHLQGLPVVERIDFEKT